MRSAASREERQACDVFFTGSSPAQLEYDFDFNRPDNASLRHSRAAGRPFLTVWGSFVHPLAEAATRVLAGRLRASLHPTTEAAAAQAAEPPHKPFAEASEAASRRTATHALGKALLGLVGCGRVLVRRCHRDAPLVVSATEDSEGTVSIGRVRVAADKRRADALERHQERLRADRDAAILSGHRAGIPQTDLAEALGVSQQLVSKVIRTRRERRAR